MHESVRSQPQLTSVTAAALVSRTRFLLASRCQLSLHGTAKPVRDLTTCVTSPAPRPPPRRLDWQEIAGCWVLAPPEGVETEAVVHFMGAAFVGELRQMLA